jgi:predicted DNA-binding protein
MKKKHPITVVLTEETHKKLIEMAKQESRPVAQMARVLIEKSVKKNG